MRRINGLLRLAGSVLISNVWLVEDVAGRRFLIDTGHPLERASLRLSLWRAGVRRPGDLNAVLLTHRHSDHAGNAAWLRAQFGCPVICHAADAPFLVGHERPPKLARGSGALYEELLCHIEDRFPARTTIDEVYGDATSRRFGFSVMHVPGHTEGSSMLHHQSTRTLFSGDAILAGPPPLRSIEWLRLAVPGFSLEVDRCRHEVRRALRELPRTDMLCSGHGPPIVDDVERKLRRLLLRN